MSYKPVGVSLDCIFKIDYKESKQVVKIFTSAKHYM